MTTDDVSTFKAAIEQAAKEMTFAGLHGSAAFARAQASVAGRFAELARHRGPELTEEQVRDLALRLMAAALQVVIAERQPSAAVEKPEDPDRQA